MTLPTLLNKPSLFLPSQDMIPIDLDYLERQCKLQGGNVEVPSHVLVELINAVRTLREFEDHVADSYTALDDTSIDDVRSMHRFVGNTCKKFSSNPMSYNF